MKPPPQYIEVWSELMNLSQKLKISVMALSATCIVMAIAMMSLAQKPIYVVRIDPEGRSQLMVSQDDWPSYQEARAFGKDFLELYMGLDSRKVEHQLRAALSMMTTRLLHLHEEQNKGTAFVRKVKSMGVVTKFYYDRVDVTQATQEGYQLELSGRVAVHPSGNSGNLGSETPFMARMSLLRVERTQKKPSGLLVDSLEYTTKPLDMSSKEE